MTRAYGGCIEPGGMDLDDHTREIDCPSCGHEKAVERTYEKAEGCINRYVSVNCSRCGHFECNEN